jgi:hypothetical protein
LFAPVGYRPVFELNAMAHTIADEITNEQLSRDLGVVPEEQGSQGHFENTKRIINEIASKATAMKYSIVDRFLMSQKRLFIASPGGSVLEISKSMVLPSQQFYHDDSDFILNRDHQYNSVDTTLWLIDCEKLQEKLLDIRDLVESLPCRDSVKFTEHKRHLEHMKNFDGWSLCLLDSAFPSSTAVLRESLDALPVTTPDGLSISKQILVVLREKKLSKSQVRDLFPSLSVRQFEHHWRLAAEVSPEISKPGRKS